MKSSTKFSMMLAALCLWTGLAGAADKQFYTEPLLFSTAFAPDPSRSSNVLTRFGPVGLSIDLIQPAFTMKIRGIEQGSPADATGKLKVGQFIQSINGRKLADIDPRIQLGRIIAEAEAGDGVLRLMVGDSVEGPAQEVVVQLPVLGAYSETWPLNCPKSDRIVRDFAEYLKQESSNKGFANIGMLFLLSTGDDSDLATVRDWARARPRETGGGYGWHIGYGGLALAEYYLRTGDQEVLPAIQALADHAVTIENFGGWANKGALGSPTYGGGGGHLSASGVLAVAYLMLAKECGAEIDDQTMQRVIRYWYRFAGRGNVPYGNNRPEGGYTDNGKNGKLAFSMAAVAALTPDGEDSLYARARDISALFSFCSTSYMLHGHTGGGIGEIWRSAAMGLLHDKQPHLYREFMDQRLWHYEMSRRWDGSFAILGGERYDNTEWGAGYALTYTIPRRTLRITGAPPTKFSKPYQLPQRPWGTAADDDFVSIEAIAYPDGSRPDFSRDTLADGGGIALLQVRTQKLTDEQLARYIRHPNLTARTYFSGQVAGRGQDFVLEVLNDSDARMRRLGLEAVNGAKDRLLNGPVFDRIIAMLADPDESWFVKELALRLMGSVSADVLAPHVDLILPYMQHEEWWLQTAALEAVAPVVADPRCYQRVLPAIGKLLETNHLFNVTAPLRWGPLHDALRAAPPEVAQLAKQTLKESYTHYVANDHVLSEVRERVNPTMRAQIAASIAKLPDGLDVLYELTRQQSSGGVLPYAELYLNADFERFSPELRQEVKKIIETDMIPRYIGENRAYLVRERANEAIPHTFRYRGARVFGLVDLYRRLGINDYDWHDFGPVPTEMAWHYHTFDPPEHKAWDTSGARFRQITLPTGMEDWFSPQFDPAKAGWKVGHQPFGAANGELVTNPGNCPYDFCRHGVPMKTLWDKEVLLMRGKFTFPQFKEGYRYRLLIGGMSHVGAGEGFRVYANGKEFMVRERGVDRREGAAPISKHIDQSWWPEFSGREVDLAHMSFMGINRGWKHRHLMIWVQEMKLPPLDDELMVHSATVLPMTSAHWQSLQDPDDADLDPEAGKFLWDGQVRENPALPGTWKVVAYVNTPDAFNPQRPVDAHRASLKELTFHPNGRTDQTLYIWSGDTLMNLGTNQALAMRVSKLGDTEYLFIEVGGFQADRGPQWKSPWIVMKREEP